MRQNCLSMRSNSVFRGMCRAIKTRDSDGQAARHPAERVRPAGTGACGAEVTGLARPRAGQDLAAAVPAPAQPRGGQGAGPQHLHRARHLAALAQVRDGMPARQAAQRRPEQARAGCRRSPVAMGTRGTLERHPTAAAPSRGERRAGPCRDHHANLEGQRSGLETHAPQLEKKRDAAAFAKSSEELDKLRAQAQAGEIELAYLDEAGFAQVHPNRSAWSPRGEQHLIDAPRGKRLNVMAALLSSGTVEHAHYWCSSTAELFLGFVADLASKVSKPLVIVLDNARIHSAAAIC